MNATSLFGAVADFVLAAPTPAPKGEIATTNILEFFASKIAPILLAVLGVIFLGRASRGEVSKVLTSSAIAIIGIAFIVGAGALFLVGANLVNIMFE
jgi:H+/gluconate symporter-like permease